MSTCRPLGKVPPGWTGFRHPNGLFSLGYPSDWQAIQPQGQGAVLACRAGPATFLEIVVIEPVNYTANQVGVLAGQMSKTMSSQHVNSRIVRDERLNHRLGYPAQRLTVEHRQDQVPSVADYFFFESGSCVVVMIVKTSSVDYANVRPIVDDIIRSVRVARPWTPPSHPAVEALFNVIAYAVIGVVLALIARYYFIMWDQFLAAALERELTAIVAWIVGAPLHPWMACGLVGAAIGIVAGGVAAVYGSDDPAPGVVVGLLIAAVLVLLCVRVLYLG